jgi:hypothetical protein
VFFENFGKTSIFISQSNNFIEATKKSRNYNLVQFSLFIISIKIRQNENFPKILLTAFAVILLANILPGVAVGGYFSAIMVAIVISL